MAYLQDKLEALHRINESILSILDINELFKKVLEIMENTFGFDACAIMLLDPKSEELYIRAALGYKPEIIKNFRTAVGGRGITGYVAKTRKPLHVPDISVDSRYIPGVNNAKSEIAIPLMVEQKQLVGVLDIESCREFTFTEDDYESLCLFASHLALAIHNALVFEEERQKVSQLMVIDMIRKRISVDWELGRILQTVAQSLAEFFGYRFVFVYVVRNESNRLFPEAAAGAEDDIPHLRGLDIDDSHIVGRAFVQKRTVMSMDSTTGLFPPPLFESAASELAIPVSIRQAPLGVIYIAGLNRDDFDDKDIRILEAISEQLSMIMKEVADLSKIIKKSKQMEIIRKIGQVVIQRFDLRKFLDDAVRLIWEIFGYFHVSFLIYEKRSEQLELAAFAGEPVRDVSVGHKLSAKEGICGYVARSGRYCLCNDTTKETRTLELLTGTKSELALPVEFDGKVMGVLNIESTKLNQFETTDAEIFTKITGQIACTMMNAELYQQKSAAHNLLMSLNSLGREINATFDLKKILSTVIQKLPVCVGCRLCSVFFHYPEQNKLVLMAHNLPDPRPEGECLLLSTGENILMTRVISLKRSIFVNNIETELEIQNRPRYETKSFLNILIRDGERTIGVLNLTDKLDCGRFRTEEFHLIHSFGEHLSNAIVNSEKYQKILELSITDGLTGLYVHRYFQETIDKEVYRSSRYDAPLSLIMMDFDNFKQFNDQYGHQIGDIILREVALLIRRETRTADVACRYGGEEFGIILPSTPLVEASMIAGRLREKIANHAVKVGKMTLRITVSVGVCEYQPETDKDDFVKQADLALLKAKSAGKDRVVVSDGGFPDETGQYAIPGIGTCS